MSLVGQVSPAAEEQSSNRARAGGPGEVEKAPGGTEAVVEVGMANKVGSPNDMGRKSWRGVTLRR